MRKKERTELNKSGESDKNIPIKDNSPRVHQMDKMKAPVRIKEYEWTEKQKEFIKLASDKETKILFVNGPAGTAKAQPLDSVVITPNGPQKMMDIKVGSLVYNRHGRTVEVLGVYPQEAKKDIYEVTFDDGTKTRCCKEHLWLGFDEDTLKAQMNILGTGSKKNVTWGVYTLEDVINLLENPSKKFVVPNCRMVDFKENYNPINPMSLGFFFACGSVDKNRVVFDDYQPKIKVLPTVLRFEKVLNIKVRSNEEYYFLERIWNNNKDRIPVEYLHTSMMNRVKFLYGFFGGFKQAWNLCSKKQFFQIETDKSLLINDVIYMIRSLGAKVFVSREETDYLPIYKIEVECPHLYVDLDWSRRDKPFSNFEFCQEMVKYVESIKRVSTEHCQCILVDDPEHVYLTDDFVVTHNTILQTYVGLLLMNENKVRQIIYVRSLAESASKGMGFLPGESSDKFKPFAAPFEDKLNELLGGADVNKLIAEKRAEAIPINFLRGKSFNSCLINLDEAQNFDVKELTTALTRVGRFSKMIVCGDTMQSDINGKSGFKKMLEIFDDEESRNNGVHVFTFTKDDIVRSGIVRYIVEKIESANLKV